MPKRHIPLSLLAVAMATSLPSPALSQTDTAKAASAKAIPEEAADAIYFNALIYTGDPLNPWTEALAIKAGKIIAIGSNAEMQALSGASTAQKDLGGQFVMPGFHDAHVHPILGGLKTQGLFVHPDSSPQRVAEIIGEYARKHPKERIIFAKGYGAQIEPDRRILDAMVPDRPVFVEGFGGHTMWLNSAALRLAGIGKDSQSPEGGAILKDPQTGEPTGGLADTAVFAVEKFLPKRAESFASKMSVGQSVSEKMASFGITSFKDAMADEDALKVYGALEKQGKLKQRAAAAILISGFGLSEEGKKKALQLVDGRAKYQTQMVNPDFVKIFLDGVPPAMALLKPPPGLKDPMTEPLIKPPELNALVADMDRRGIGVMAHAHGDAAILGFINAVEFARKENGAGVTHQIAHCSSIRPSDAQRLKALNMVCEMSPYYWFPNGGMDAAKILFGAPFVDHAYPANLVVSSGGVLAAGSDWAYDNLDLNPLPYIEALVTRKDPFDRRSEILNPDQQISIAQALYAFTLGGAIAAGTGARNGSLEIGKDADFIVLDHNIFAIPAQDISDIKVTLTVMNGNRQFEMK